MAVPLFNINDNFAINFLPLYKRLPKWIQTIRGYLGTLTWSESVFRRFMNGSDDLTFYSAAVTYSKYDKIKDNFAVFESKQDVNIGNPTSDTDWWEKTLDSFISKSERVTYVCRKLQFEQALNHYFAQQIDIAGYVGFINPTSIVGDSYSPNSDIYIDVILPDYYSTLGFDDLHFENTIYSQPVQTFVYDDIIAVTSSFYKYSINIPTAVFDLLGSNDVIRESVVRNFADQINGSGLQYEILTY